METTELLLSRGASVTLVDAAGFTPVLAMAPTPETALCLANMLEEYLRLPGAEARRSIQSVLANGDISRLLYFPLVWLLAWLYA